MAIEDFTTYTEVDADGDITVAAGSVTIATMDRWGVSYVYRQYADNTFGNFVHLVDVNWTAATGDAAQIAYWQVTNSSYTVQDAYDNLEGLLGGLYRASSSDYRITIRNSADGTVDYASYASAPGQRYLRLQRSGSVFTCVIYTDAARTTVEDTLSVACATTTYKNIVVASSRDASDVPEASAISAVIANLDLQFVSGSGESQTIRTGVGIKARSSVIAAPVQQARKPYLHLKSSMREFFTEHVRFIKSQAQKESSFEKPYLDTEYPTMHLSIPAPDWPTWNKFDWKPGEWKTWDDINLPKGGAQGCAIANCLMFADTTIDCEAFPASVFGAIWCTFYPGSNADCKIMAYAAAGKIKNTEPAGNPWAQGIEMEVWVDPAVEKHLICGRMVDGLQHICEECVEVVCVCNCNTVTPMTLDSANTDTTVAPGGAATVTVLNGCGPFSWSLSGQGYVLGAAVTEGRSNTITNVGSACGSGAGQYAASVTVSVTDDCGTSVSAIVLNTAGTWSDAYDYTVNLAVGSCSPCYNDGATTSITTTIVANHRSVATLTNGYGNWCIQGTGPAWAQSDCTIAPCWGYSPADLCGTPAQCGSLHGGTCLAPDPPAGCTTPESCYSGIAAYTIQRWVCP